MTDGEGQFLCAECGQFFGRRDCEGIGTCDQCWGELFPYCSAVTKRGTACMNKCVPGEMFCSAHLGMGLALFHRAAQFGQSGSQSERKTRLLERLKQIVEEEAYVRGVVFEERRNRD